ncbi:MAG: PP2C family protein-serine/threonine phosphatase [Phycisphaerae bacterium]
MSQLMPAAGCAPGHGTESDLMRQIDSTIGLEGCCGWPGARVAVKRIPSVGFGGDFHNITHRTEGQHAVVVGTVSGPGLVAALAKATIARAIGRHGSVNRSPVALITFLDELLDRLNTDLGVRSITCSVFIGLVDRARQTLAYTAAGSIRPYIQTRDGSVRDLLTGTPALGAPERVEREPGSLDLASVQRLMIHTEGLCQAQSTAGESYGASRSRKLLTETARLPVDRQLAAVAEDVHAHIGPLRTPTEDVTVFVAHLGDDRMTTPNHASFRDVFNSYENTGGPPLDSSVFLG